MRGLSLDGYNPVVFEDLLYLEGGKCGLECWLGGWCLEGFGVL